MSQKHSILNIPSASLRILIMLATLLGSLSPLAGVRALGATISVSSILDNSIAGNGYCTLREAINNANANSDTTGGDCAAGTSAGVDTIVFSNLLLTPATIRLGSSLPTISDAAGLTIDAADAFTINGNNSYRVLTVGGGAVLTLDSLTILNGKVTTGTGGGVYNAGGTLTLTNCLLSGNSAVDGQGGGLYSTGGTLTITDTIFTSNIATQIHLYYAGYGGGVYTASPTTIVRTIFSGNSADARGGGLYDYLNTVSIADSVYQTNSMSSAGDGGGGIYNEQGTLSIAHSTFTGNAANSDASNAGGIFNDHGSVTITRSTFSGNSVTHGGGGAIASDGTLNVANSTFSGNLSDAGAGIYNDVGGTLTSTNNTFSGNTTLFTSVTGGGIYNAGTLNLDNTILANTVNGGDCYNSAGTVSGANNLIETAGSGACGLTDGINGNIIGSDPGLGAATLLDPVYFPLQTGSPAVDAGNDVKCAAAPVGGTSQNNITRPQSTHCDIGAFELPLTTVSIVSTGAQDGWILESSETSGTGGSLNATGTTFQLGDDALNKQYRVILSFNTASLPDTATIQSAVLNIKQSGARVGVNPFGRFGILWADIRTGPFGSAALQLTDFKSAASAAKAGGFGAAPVNGWYSAALNATGRTKINTMGLTQLRLYFATDDNNNYRADYMKFFSGNSARGQPTLVITFNP